MARRTPKQKRSREAVERMLEATASVISDRGITGLTMGAVADRAGVSTATVYRYFADTDELAAAFFDGEMEKMNLNAAQAFLALETVTVHSIVETAMFAHLRHHQRYPEIARAWFHAPRSEVVHAHVTEQDQKMGAWLRAVMNSAGMLREDAPPDAEVALVVLGDRAFEWLFSQSWNETQQNDFVRHFVEMVASYLERFATPKGTSGLSNAEFMSAIAAAAEEFEAMPESRPAT